MTDKHDKLVEIALKSGAVNHFVQGLPDRYAFSLGELTAFAAAHVASLCADVEPVAWLVEWEYLAVQEWRGGQKTARETWAKCGTMVDSVDEAIALIPEEKVWRNKTVSTLYPASTVASLTAQRDAALARVAELEAALRTADHTFAENGILASHAARQEIQAALTKGQP